MVSVSRLICHAMKRHEVDYGYSLASSPYPCPSPASSRSSSAEKDARNGSAQWRFCVAACVPILWTHHAALRNVLPGVWQGTQSRLELDKNCSQQSRERKILLTPLRAGSISQLSTALTFKL